MIIMRKEQYSRTVIITGVLLIYFRVNVMQAVYLVRSALPHLNASHGNIVAISSGSGIYNCCDNFSVRFIYTNG